MYHIYIYVYIVHTYIYTLIHDDTKKCRKPHHQEASDRCNQFHNNFDFIAPLSLSPNLISLLQNPIGNIGSVVKKESYQLPVPSFQLSVSGNQHHLLRINHHVSPITN